MIRDGLMDFDDPETVRHYFDRLYGEGADLGKDVQKKREETQFRDVADAFDMIADFTQDVIVPHDDRARELIGELRSGRRPTMQLLRDLQAYVVGLTPDEFRVARLAVLEQIPWRGDVWISRDGFYDKDLGLNVERTAADMIV
jgi:hypothetical protein